MARLRRYTAVTNPDREAMLLHVPSCQLISQLVFAEGSLTYTVRDALEAVEEAAVKGALTALLMVDEASVVLALRAALKAAGVEVVFYEQPSEEEVAHAAALTHLPAWG